MTLPRFLLLSGLVFASGGALFAASPVTLGDEGVDQCTIDFDSVCPDTAEVCMAKSRGGAGCVVDGLPFCYESGMFSYRVNAGTQAKFFFLTVVHEIELFFAQGAAGRGGRIAFFDENGLQVGAQIQTNGVCADAMPPTQTVIFERPVKKVRVRAIDTDVYIDSMTLTRY